MGDDNVWLAGRRQEQAALGRIIVAVGTGTDEARQAVRGAGVAARTETITDGPRGC
jgi:hypothetical protein